MSSHRVDEAGARAYDPHWEADILLADGQVARLRPLGWADEAALEYFWTRLSTKSQYFRFFSAHPSLKAADRERFLGADHSQRVVLGVFTGAALIAIGDFARTAPTEAELAFVVADELHGYGVGGLLLEHLAQIARELGIRMLTAEVLPANDRMIASFRAAGYAMRTTLTGDALHFAFAIEPTETSMAVMTAREHRAEASSMRRIFQARTVAIVGGSAKPRTTGRRLLRNVLGGEFEGRIYLVNHAVDAAFGIPSYDSVLELPEPIDLAVIAVRADLVPGVVADCAARKVHAVVVISIGYAEAGWRGRRRQAELLTQCRSAGIRLIGPCALGLINPAGNSLNASMCDVQPRPGTIGFCCQSGPLSLTSLRTLVESGLGVSSFVSAGNRADVSANDLLQYWDEDEHTEVILSYLESLGNAEKFFRIARRVSRRKPIVVLTAGRSGFSLGLRPEEIADGAVRGCGAAAGIGDGLIIEGGDGRDGSATLVPAGWDEAAGLDDLDVAEGVGEAGVSRVVGAETAKIIEANTAAASAAVLDAMFRQAGVIRVDHIEHLIDVAQVLARQPLPPGDRLAIVGDSPELTIIAADVAAQAGFRTTATWLGLAALSAATYAAKLREAMADDEVDAVLAVFVPAPAETKVELNDIRAVIAELGDHPGKPLVAVIAGDEGDLDLFQGGSSEADPAGSRSLRGTVPTYPGPERAVLALSKAWQYAQWRSQADATLPILHGVAPDAASTVITGVLGATPAGRPLTDEEVIALLGYYGIPVLPYRRVTRLHEAVAASRGLGWDVAVKVTNPAVGDASDQRVWARIRDENELSVAWRQLTQTFGEPEAAQVVVQGMGRPGLHLSIKACEDPQLGPILAFRVAGVAARLLHDVSYRLTPLSRADAAAMVREVRLAPMLTGGGGFAPRDVAAVEELLVRIAQLKEHQPDVDRVDVEVLAHDRGLSVLGARAWVRPHAPRPEVYARRLSSSPDGM